MKDFLKEFWLWILVPFALMGALLVALLLLGGDGSNPFTYNIF